MDMNSIILIIIVIGAFAYVIHKKKKKALKPDANTNADTDTSASYVTGRYSGLNRDIHGVTFCTVPPASLYVGESADVNDAADYDLMLERNLRSVIDALNSDHKKILSISHVATGSAITFYILY